MSTSIRCPWCESAMTMGASAVTVECCPDTCELVGFTCPSCGARLMVCGSAEELATLGIPGLPVNVVPAEALEEHVGPPLTADDLVDFHALLASPDCRVALETSVRKRRA